jgi:hypothetical protein
LFASRAVTVIVEADDPSATTLNGETTTPDCPAVATPAVNSTLAVSVINVPDALVPRYPRTVTDPAVVDVTVAVATPDAFVVHGPELNDPVPDAT